VRAAPPLPAAGEGAGGARRAKHYNVVDGGGKAVAKILVVEDDRLLSRLVRDYLASEHHNVEVADTGSTGMEMLECFRYDAIILDWELPGMTGIEILKRFRAKGGKTPVLMLTQRGSINEKETGFDSGTDDYLTKPFEMRELSARVRALLRRPAVFTGRVLAVRDIALDPGSHKVTRNGQEVDLLPKEFALLEFLLRHPGEVFSAEALLDRVWSSESESTEEAVSTCVRRLRKKVDDEGKPSLIQTVHGVGYRLAAD